MSSRRKRNVSLASSYNPNVDLGFSRWRLRKAPGRIAFIKTYLPRSVAIKARREIYPYPYPNPRQKLGRSIRVALRRSRAKMVPVIVKVRLPSHLPLVRSSMVSVRPDRLTIHSWKQVQRSIEDAREFNRRRYSEHKGHKRKGRYGQLESRGSERFGSVAEASRRGASIDQIADAALVARALR